MRAESANEAWEELTRAAHRREPEDVDMFGPWPDNDGEDWTVRVDNDRLAVFDGIARPLGVLLHDARLRLVRERVVELEIRREIVRQAAIDLLFSRQGRSWTEVVSLVASQLTKAVVAVPVGGVYSTAVDSEGYGCPSPVGPSAVVGHLDVSLESAIDALARQQGLVGFRFSDDSWWTEELIAGKNDPQIGQEILESYADGASWPWLVLATTVLNSGLAAELQAVLNTEAFIGALVLLAHLPGEYWHEGLPWIPADQSRAQYRRPPTLGDVEPQIVDGRAIHLQTATTESVLGTPPAELNASWYITGPARELLVRVIDPDAVNEALAAGCRLALHAAGTWSPEPSELLAAAAAARFSEHLTSSKSEAAYDAAIQRGMEWRLAHDAQWPRNWWDSEEELNMERWSAALPSYSDIASEIEALPLRLAVNGRGADGQALLHAAQALAFAAAADLA
jgi:hypothetical protein